MKRTLRRNKACVKKRKKVESLAIKLYEYQKVDRVCFRKI